VNSRYERENAYEDLRDTGEPDREISLGTTTILGIFLGLALVCAAFFGFGYSLGRHSAQPAANAAEAGASDSGSGSKPSSASLLPQDRSSGQQTGTTPGRAPQDDSTSDDGDSDQSKTAASPVKTVVVTPTASARVVSPPKPAAPKAAVPGPAIVADGPGTAVVQVAAVSHKEDADMLAAALKRRGYSVTVRQTPADKLLHVQVGPFATKKDADAMRQRLQADGYNAIVK
jgi:cell division protein FtsN